MSSRLELKLDYGKDQLRIWVIRTRFEVHSTFYIAKRISWQIIGIPYQSLSSLLQALKFDKSLPYYTKRQRQLGSKQ